MVSVQVSPAYGASNRGAGQTLTISSLHGRYIYIVIQVTRDLYPVVLPEWLLPGTDFELGVADVTLAQFESISKALGRDSISSKATPTELTKNLPRVMVSLENFLRVGL